MFAGRLVSSSSIKSLEIRVHMLILSTILLQFLYSAVTVGKHHNQTPPRYSQFCPQNKVIALMRAVIPIQRVEEDTSEREYRVTKREYHKYGRVIGETFKAQERVTYVKTVKSPFFLYLDYWKKNELKIFPSFLPPAPTPSTIFACASFWRQSTCSHIYNLHAGDWFESLNSQCVAPRSSKGGGERHIHTPPFDPMKWKAEGDLSLDYARSLKISIPPSPLRLYYRRTSVLQTHFRRPIRRLKWIRVPYLCLFPAKETRIESRKLT